MIFITQNEREILEKRNNDILCHPKYTDETLHNDERIISSGSTNGIITPMECCDTSLLINDSIVAAINGERLVINLDKAMYPDVARLINIYIESATEYSLNIHPHKWTVGNTEVPPTMSEWDLDTHSLVSEDLDDEFSMTRDKRSKLISVYVDNVIDAAYQECPNNEAKDLQGMFIAIDQMHNKNRVERTTVNPEKVEATLETMGFGYVILDGMLSAISNIVIVDRSAVMKPSSVKRLLSTYMSYVARVPYVPPTPTEIKRSISYGNNI
jgi:hypothetical protein